MYLNVKDDPTDLKIKEDSFSYNERLISRPAHTIFFREPKTSHRPISIRSLRPTVIQIPSTSRCRSLTLCFRMQILFGTFIQEFRVSLADSRHRMQSYCFRFGFLIDQGNVSQCRVVFQRKILCSLFDLLETTKIINIVMLTEINRPVMSQTKDTLVAPVKTDIR